MSDYSLLEDAGRVSAASLRATAATAPVAQSANARSKRAILAREAAIHKVQLHLLPNGFARGKRNSSHARGRKGVRQLYWHIDVVVAHQDRERRVSVDSCADSTTIGEIIQGVVGAFSGKKRRRGEVGRLPSLAESDLDVFILNEHVVGTASSGPEHAATRKAIGEDDMHRYLPLNTSDTLQSVLRDRIIIEFPIFYCAIRNSPEAIRLAEAMAGVFEKPEPESDGELHGVSDEDSESESERSQDSLTQSLSEGELKDENSVEKNVTSGGQAIVEAEELLPQQPMKRARVSPSSEVTEPLTSEIGL